MPDNKIISWEEVYVVGIEQIDHQHKELVSLVNQLFQACLEGNEHVAETFKETMSSMVDYVRFHFTAEQKLLTRINYPNFIEHKKQHDTLVLDILNAAKEYNEGKKFIPNNFVRTLRDWVLSHIAVSDKSYAAYIQEQKHKGLLTDKQING